MKLNEGTLELPSDPLKAFEQWFEEARQDGSFDATAMTLATISEKGRPAARIVLFKGLSKNGIEFFTNYESRKSQELIKYPAAALVFHWPTLHRQIRIEGAVEKLTYEESDQYFQTRPRGSQVGAWSSPQSRVITSRSELESRLQASEEKFKEGPVPCPEFWGGFRVKPDLFEFWEERPFRLHERLQYALDHGVWQKSRLAP